MVLHFRPQNLSKSKTHLRNRSTTCGMNDGSSWWTFIKVMELEFFGKSDYQPWTSPMVRVSNNERSVTSVDHGTRFLESWNFCTFLNEKCYPLLAYWLDFCIQLFWKIWLVGSYLLFHSAHRRSAFHLTSWVSSCATSLESLANGRLTRRVAKWLRRAPTLSFFIFSNFFASFCIAVSLPYS